MQTIQPFATLLGAGPTAPGPAFPIKRVSAATRTAQSIGIEWYDYLRQSRGDTLDAVRKLAAARSPGAALAIQTSFLREAGARWAAQAPVIGTLYGQMIGDLMGLGSVQAPARASAKTP